VKPVEFPEQTIIWAKNQPPYFPLPAYTDEKETISCWKLTLTERIKILLFGRLWLRQMNFGGPLQPQSPTVERPFL
jgi:hypothetical protein